MNELKKYYRAKTDDELQEEAQQIHTSIYSSECFNCKDLLRYFIIVGILEERGFSSINNLEILNINAIS